MSRLNIWETESGALFSSCRTYRYALWRHWAVERCLHGEPVSIAAFIGLNPSTANEKKDDPTIRRCKGFAKAWGCSGLLMLNLAAFRTADPRELFEAAAWSMDIIGPENTMQHLSQYTIECGVIVAAWGAHAKHRYLDKQRKVLTRAFGTRLQQLGLTQSGQPRHPLYLPRTAKLQVYEEV